MKRNEKAENHGRHGLKTGKTIGSASKLNNSTNLLEKKNKAEPSGFKKSLEANSSKSKGIPRACVYYHKGLCLYNAEDCKGRCERYEHR